MPAVLRSADFFVVVTIDRLLIKFKLSFIIQMHKFIRHVTADSRELAAAMLCSQPPAVGRPRSIRKRHTSRQLI